jgi:hypothetical protein
MRGLLMDKQLRNTLTEMCNLLDTEKMIICYGDCTIEFIVSALNQFKLAANPIKCNVIDYNNEKPSDALSNLINTGGLIQNEIIYLIDNCESISKAEIAFLIKLKTQLQQSSKSVILLMLNLEKLPTDFQSFRKFKVGTVNQDETLQSIVLQFFNETNREKCIFALQNTEYPLQYIITLIAYNIPFFYTNDILIQNNLSVLNTAGRYLYKVDTEKVLRHLCQLFVPTNVKKVLRFPPRNKKVN